jgi:hypothetical protein
LTAFFGNAIVAHPAASSVTPLRIGPAFLAKFSHLEKLTFPLWYLAPQLRDTPFSGLDVFSVLPQALHSLTGKCPPFLRGKMATEGISPALSSVGRPDKCLVVSLDSNLRPVCPSQHGIHRHHHQGAEGRQEKPLLGISLVFRCCGVGGS